MMRKILIIEENSCRAMYLGQMIKNIDPYVKVYGPLESVRNVVDELSVHNDYDMILSSITLVDGNVFDAFKEVVPKSCVIFTTAFGDFPQKSSKCVALNDSLNLDESNEYLLKGVFSDYNVSDDKGELGNEIRKVFNSVKKYRTRFLVNKGEEIVVLDVNDINYICVEGNHVYAYTDENIPLPLLMTMIGLEHELDPKRFFRVNRRYIVSIKGIEKITQYFCSKLLIRLKGCSDNNIVISKERASSLKKWLDG